MQVGVIGMNHKIADLKLREALARACQRGFRSITAQYRAGASVVLSTCNRTEIYFSSDDLAQTQRGVLDILREELDLDFEQRLYSYFGVDCFTHLARVTAGLDSAIVGETEIQGQVKLAYEDATESQVLPATMHYIFQKALKIGKQVRTSLPLARAQYDLEHAVLGAARHFFDDLKEVSVLFVGASDINKKVYTYLESYGISRMTICNRSRENALDFVGDGTMEFLAWNEVTAWHTFDWIIFGTKCPDYVLNSENLAKDLDSHHLIIDLSVPRNVDPVLARHPKISLLNIDQVNRMMRHRRRQLGDTIVQAEESAKELSRRQAGLFQDKEKARSQWMAVSA